MSMKFISIRSIIKKRVILCTNIGQNIVDVIYMHLHVTALNTVIYNICIVLQIDQCRYFLTVLTIPIRYKAEIKDNRHFALLMRYIHAHFQVSLV